MKVLVFGATGRTGRLVVQGLVQGGHAVTAASRRGTAMEGATAMVADLSADGVGPGALRAAAGEHEAVISALASGKNNRACLTLAKALAGLDGLRFITVAGAAVDAPGDAKALPDRMIGGIMRRVAGAMLAERQAEHDLLAGSALRWTMLRPPRLTDGPATGAPRLTFDTPASTKLARADLAQVAVAALTRDDLIGRAPFVAA